MTSAAARRPQYPTHTPAPAPDPDRYAQLNALAALFAERHGDTEPVTAERQRVLFTEVGAYKADQERRNRADRWDEAIREAAAELASGGAR